jgi:very-short-patch-repair endonuclease
MEKIDADPGRVLTRAELKKSGLTGREITAAVSARELIRVRRDRYMLAPHAGIDRAVRMGGRLACVSRLAPLGVFVLDAALLHVHVERTMSRLRHPDDRSRPFTRRKRADVVLHWTALRCDGADAGSVGLLDAIAQAVRCQGVRDAVATVDSLLHLGLVSRQELADVFAMLPRQYGVVLRLADARAESGPESYMRLLLRQLDVRYEPQVDIEGVGRVDFLVDGWLIIECDSKAHHEGWDKQRADRRRDLDAARLGYATLRPLAEDLFHHRDEVLTAVRGIVRSRRIRVR